jgi:hypothetical protein
MQFYPRIITVEREIIKWKEKLHEEEERFFDEYIKKNCELSEIELIVKNCTSEIRHEIELLELERKFLLERYNNLFWRVVWSVIIPVLVSLITIYISIKLGLKI